MDGSWPQWRDAILPAGLAVLAVVELLGSAEPGRLGAGVVEVLSCAALLFRRRHPIGAGFVVSICLAGVPWLGPAIDEVATPILILALSSYSLARWVRGYAGLVGLAFTLLLLTFDYATVDLRRTT